jgi:hypothetical protein
MRGLFEKLFCKHEWYSHAKETHEWDEIETIPETRFWLNPEFQTISYSETTEVLICKKCGKIKIITY